MNDRTIVVTLVHGTWGRGFFPSARGKTPRWFECGSPFQERLTKHLRAAGAEPEYSDFTWSGANSILERDKAADVLANHLEDQTKTNKDRKRLVIAHSHGGNVAMRALHKLHARHGQETVLLVTLATPFIQMFLQYPQSPANKTYEALAVAVSGGLVVSSVLAPWWGIASGVGRDGVLGLSAALALIGLGIPWLLLGGWWPRSRRSARMSDLFEAALVPPGKVSLGRLLVLRGTEDEAGLSLAFGAFGARLSYLFAVLGVQLFTRWRSVSLLAVLTAWMTYYFTGIPGAIVLFRDLFVTALALITTGSILCVICKCAHGRELLRGGLVCEVGSTAVPDNLAPDLTVVTLPVQMERRLTFRHSLYDHRFCGQAIEDWLRMALDDSVESRRTLSFLVDFLNESPVAGLDTYFVVTEQLRQQIEEDRRESERVRREQFGTDEEWALELAESEDYNRKLLAFLEEQKGPRTANEGSRPAVRPPQ